MVYGGGWFGVGWFGRSVRAVEAFEGITGDADAIASAEGCLRPFSA